MKHYASNPRKERVDAGYKKRGNYIGQWMPGAAHPIWPTYWQCNFSAKMSD